MKHKPALYALTRLYAELQGELRQARRNEVLIRGEIEHVKATIRLLDSDFDLASVKPRTRQQVNPAFRRGQCFRVALEVLRQGNEPLPTAEIARRVLVALGNTAPDTAAIRKMFGAIYPALRRREGNRVRAYQEIEIKPTRWALS